MSVNFEMVFWCLQIDHKTKEIFIRISALASKKRSNQIFFERLKRNEVILSFRWYFGPNDDTKRTFRN